MADNVFTKIVRGEIPAHKIYEDDKTLAFLTIEPIRPGHTLVIPKKDIDPVWDLEDQDYQAVMATTKKVAKRLKEVMGTKRIGLKVVGEEVPYAHVHLIPFDTTAEFYGRVLGKSESDNDTLAKLAAKLAF